MNGGALALQSAEQEAAAVLEAWHPGNREAPASPKHSSEITIPLVDCPLPFTQALIGFLRLTTTP